MNIYVHTVDTWFVRCWAMGMLGGIIICHKKVRRSVRKVQVEWIYILMEFCKHNIIVIDIVLVLLCFK